MAEQTHPATLGGSVRPVWRSASDHRPVNPTFNLSQEYEAAEPAFINRDCRLDQGVSRRRPSLR
jgi:hypothetical protein